MVTFVYPYMEILAQGSTRSVNGMCELKWSIRSLCKHVKFDFDIVIVGDKPEWYNGKHIQTGKVRNVDFAKALDIAKKLKAITQSDLITEDFIYMYDDIYLVGDCTMADFQKIVAIGPAHKGSQLTSGSGKYRQLFQQTIQALNMDNFYMYETHLPRVLNKTKLDLIHRAYNLNHRPLLFSTLYFNEFEEKPDVCLIEKNDIKAAVYSKMSYSSIVECARGKKFMNNSEQAFNDGLIKYLNSNFPEKSIFETP